MSRDGWGGSSPVSSPVDGGRSPSPLRLASFANKPPLPIIVPMATASLLTDSGRLALRSLGMAQVVTALITLPCANIISNLFAIACGSVLVHNFTDRHDVAEQFLTHPPHPGPHGDAGGATTAIDVMGSPGRGRRCSSNASDVMTGVDVGGGTPASTDALPNATPPRRRTACCCSPRHIPGLGAMVILGGLLELGGFAVGMWQASTWRPELLIFNLFNHPPYPTATEEVLWRYVSIAVFLGCFVPVIHIALAGVALTVYDNFRDATGEFVMGQAAAARAHALRATAKQTAARSWRNLQSALKTPRSMGDVLKAAAAAGMMKHSPTFLQSPDGVGGMGSEGGAGVADVTGVASPLASPTAAGAAGTGSASAASTALFKATSRSKMTGTTPYSGLPPSPLLMSASQGRSVLTPVSEGTGGGEDDSFVSRSRSGASARRPSDGGDAPQTAPRPSPNATPLTLSHVLASGLRSGGGASTSGTPAHSQHQLHLRGRGVDSSHLTISDGDGGGSDTETSRPGESPDEVVTRVLTESQLGLDGKTSFRQPSPTRTRFGGASANSNGGAGVVDRAWTGMTSIPSFTLPGVDGAPTPHTPSNRTTGHTGSHLFPSPGREGDDGGGVSRPQPRPALGSMDATTVIGSVSDHRSVDSSPESRVRLLSTGDWDGEARAPQPGRGAGSVPRPPAMSEGGDFTSTHAAISRYGSASGSPAVRAPRGIDGGGGGGGTLPPPRATSLSVPMPMPMPMGGQSTWSTPNGPPGGPTATSGGGSMRVASDRSQPLLLSGIAGTSPLARSTSLYDMGDKAGSTTRPPGGVTGGGASSSRPTAEQVARVMVSAPSWIVPPKSDRLSLGMGTRTLSQSHMSNMVG